MKHHEVQEAKILNPMLMAKDITKIFPGVVALNKVSFDVMSGEIHGLLGQNGAGKSTLLKIIYGVHRPDGGEIYIDGKRVLFKSPRDAREHGIVLVHQEITVLPHLSALENIALLGFMWKKWSHPFNKRDFEYYVENLLSEYGFELNLRSKVRDLSVAEKMLVQIIAALSINAKLLLLDEPTSPMSPKEIEKLFIDMEKLKKEGIGIVFVTHRVNEALQICDRITVLRNGIKVATVNSKDVNTQELVKLMLGRELKEFYLVRDFTDIDSILAKAVKSIPLIELRDIVTQPRTVTEVPLKRVNLKVYQGEVVAVVGLLGAGKTELGKTMIGLTKVIGGEIRYLGRPVKITSPAHALKLGILYLPEDRRMEGLIPEYNVIANMDISTLSSLSRGGLIIDFKREAEIGNEMVRKLNIVTPSLYVKILKLSGGNQQKVLVARAILSKAKLTIFDEPTIGIDIGAKVEIRRLMYRIARDQEIGVLLLTSDIDEALGVADRIYVMREGTIVGEFINKNLDRDAIVKLLA